MDAEEILRDAAGQLSSQEIVKGDLRGAAAKLVARFDEEVCREAAVIVLMDSARHRWRMRNLELEREAQRTQAEAGRIEESQRVADRESAAAATGGYSHGSTNKRNTCTCDICNAAFAAAAAVQAEIDQRFWRKMQKIVDDFSADLRMEWTQELLDAGFALPDGSIRTWRDATVEEHEKRVEMLTRNAVANAEAAARHRSAIATIAAAGARTLGEAVA